jgi:hypothetical protein
MSPLVPIEYSGFYDVPRGIIVEYRGQTFLLLSLFDEQRDEYPDAYTVYLLPRGTKAQLASAAWEVVAKAHGRLVGQLPIEAVAFDPTKRKTMDSSVLDPFLR